MHVYDIYEPLRLALQTHGTLKANVKIIPIVISRTCIFHVKTLAEIAQLISFKEEPPDELAFKQLPITAKRIGRNGAPRTCTRMAISYIKKLEKDPHHEKKNGHKHFNLSTEVLCPKTLLILAAGAEEEDVEQEDVVYTVGSFSLP